MAEYIDDAAPHLVLQIAREMKDKLDGRTPAQFNVWIERDTSQPFSPEDLPAIDIRIGPDDASDDLSQTKYRSEVTMYVDLITLGPEVDRLLKMREMSYKRIMEDYPRLGTVDNAWRILSGGAEEHLDSADGGVPVKLVRTVYFVSYEHSHKDPTQ